MTNRCADNVIFVQCILPHREYLFSKFSPKITHEGKKLRWLYIRDQLVASGMAHFVGKDDSYMRQKWADMKRRTIEKLGRVGQNSRANLSEVDTLILRIIGDKEVADRQTHESNDSTEKNLLKEADEHFEATAHDGNGTLLLLNQQHQNLAQNSANFASAKCEPITHNQQHVSVVPLQQQHEHSPQKVPLTPTNCSSVPQPPHNQCPLFDATVTENAIIPLAITTTRRKRKKFFFKRGDRMPKPCNQWQNELHNDQHQTENGDLEEQIKRAKLAYYKSQIDLNNSLKSESIMRKRLLTLQIEQIQQEIEGEAEDIEEH